MERGFIGLNIAVLAIGEAMSIDDEPPAALIIERMTHLGHTITTRAVVPDSLQMIRAKFLEFIADPTIDVVIATAGTRTEYAAQALAPLVTRMLAGFRDLFRYMTFEEIGTAAMLVDAEAAQCKSTFVFLLPASIGAVRTALDKLIAPQLDYRTKPQNLVMRMPRVAHVDSPEKTEPAAPWIQPKKSTMQIAAVPAPTRATTRPATQPPPIPTAKVAVPQFVTPEQTPPGPAPVPASRQKVSTIVAPLPNKPPAAAPQAVPIVPLTEDATTVVKEREIEDRSGPVSRASTPSIVVDKSLSQPIPVARRGFVVNHEDLEGMKSGPVMIPGRRGVSRTFILAWTAIAIAAAAGILFYLRSREPLPAIERGDQVATREVAKTETRSDPPAAPPAPAPPVATPPAEPAPSDHEIEMAPADPPASPPVVAKPVAEKPVVVKAPIAAARPATKPKVPSEPSARSSDKPVAEGCDQVSCVLDKFRLPCCAKFKPAEEAAAPPPASDEVPEKIDRAMILAGIAKVRATVMRCGDKSDAKGTVKVIVQVGADGKVSDISVATTPDEALGECVADVIRKASFGKTQAGGSFGFPFSF